MTILPSPPCGQRPQDCSTRSKRSLGLGLIIVLGLHSGTHAASESLDSAALQKLSLQGTWAAEDAEVGYWTWNKDKSVCLRLGSAEGKCADTGTWAINDNVICYELTWWGESNNDRKTCFTVKSHGSGRYEALYHGGAMVSTYYHFSVLE